MSELTGVPLMAEPRDFVLWRSGRDYYAAGRKVARVVGGDWLTKPRLKVYDEDLLRLLQGHRPGRRPVWLRRSAEETRQLLIEANGLRLVLLEEEAIDFLHQVREQYINLPMVVSWSGGKDSTAVSILAQRAFPHERIVHIFADTTNEMPCTYEYLRTFRAAYPAVPLLVGMPSRDFIDLCREIGPPSRIQRWCCTTQKAVPLANILRGLGRGSPVLVVSGLRRMESRRREGYNRVINSTKIGLQILMNPVLDWTDFDVWTWTEARAVPVNPGYQYGLDRIGCLYCPIAPSWGDMVAAKLYDGCFDEWANILLKTAQSADLDDAEDYVASGAWRNRRGGAIGQSGLPNAHLYDIQSRPCVLGEPTTFYETSVEFDLRMLGELLKVFGEITAKSVTDAIGNFSVAGPHGGFTVVAGPKSKYVRVTFDSYKSQRRLENTVRMQLRKLQACVGCGGCAALCPQGAIVKVGSEYTIVNDLCTHCLQCVRGVKAGCWAADSLHGRAVETVG